MFRLSYACDHLESLVMGLHDDVRFRCVKFQKLQETNILGMMFGRELKLTNILQNPKVQKLTVSDEIRVTNFRVRRDCQELDQVEGTCY